jgi:alpha-beta hydrolase superfamily lysophospholipase
MRHLLRHFLLFLLYGALATLLVLLGVYVLRLEERPDLKPWHLARLDSEFRAADAERVRTLEDYRLLETRLFDQLGPQVYDRVAQEDQWRLNRYSRGSLADPSSYPRNWNRTYELPVENPRGGVLLLHGLSDSPYSLRALGGRLHARGFWVVGLRLPGHGTEPSELTRLRWQDMTAAARLGARAVRERVGPERPLYIVGYSNGAALALEYALACGRGEELPAPAGLVLISPAIGVSGAARLAVWQARLAMVPRLEKVAWLDLLLEYDPFKYNSFPVNAAQQVYALTMTIHSQLASGASQGVKGLPPILAFQSMADATVSTPAVIDTLFRKLAPEGHALVLFDINRRADAEPLLLPSAREELKALLTGPVLPFDLTVLANESEHSDRIVALRRAPGQSTVAREATELAWPPDVFSLSHVALPFPPDDPVYGAQRPAHPHRIYLGRPELLGERGLLALPVSSLIRLRHNPFFSYMDARIEAFLAQRQADGSRCGEAR